MPNNFIFNKSAQDLKVEMYGNAGGTLTPLAVDGTGNLAVSVISTPSVNIDNIPSVEIHSLAANVTFPVTVANTPSVNVDNIPSVEIHSLAANVTFPVTVANTPSVNVDNIPSVEIHSLAANVTFPVTVANTPSVNVDNIPSVEIHSLAANVTFPVTVANTPSVNVDNIPSVEIHSVATTTDTLNVTTGTGINSILAKDTSMQQQYSYYISNLDGPTLTAYLQVAPINTETYYVNDTATPYTVNSGSILILSPQYYMHYTRLWYDSGANTASFIAYYNSQI